MMPSPDFAPIRFSTDDLEERFRIEAWREIFGRKVIKTDVEPRPHAPFRSEITLRALPGLGVASGFGSPASYRHTREFTDNDDLLFFVQIEGTGLAAQLDRELSVESGFGTLLWGAEPGNTDFDANFRYMSIALPYKAMAPMISDPVAAIARPIPPNTEAMRLMVNYIAFGLMQGAHALATPELRAAVVAHIYDLAALAIGATRDAAEVSKGRGVAAARLQAIKTDIARHAWRQSFSVDQVALRIGVSSRYIRRLFEATGETFSEFVLAHRLAQAHRLLIDRQHDGRPISAVAFDVGFSDLSYFNRTFRRRYGATPSEVRDGSPRSA